MQMNKKNILSIMAVCSSLLLAYIVMASNGDTNNLTYKPKDGYVPNAETAMRIAEAVWIPIYGAKLIEAEKPFQARLLKGDIWRVEGTFKGAKGRIAGGVALAEIAKDDGRIIRVIHGK
jgi:hypothetical protein